MPLRRRTNFPKDVRRAALDRACGRCEGDLVTGLRCEGVLQIGHYVFDHIITDFHGGRADLSNCQVICKDCDRAKTAGDQAAIADTRRAYDAHRSLRAPRRPMAGSRYSPDTRGLDGIVRDRTTGVVKTRAGSIDVEDL